MNEPVRLGRAHQVFLADAVSSVLRQGHEDAAGPAVEEGSLASDR